MVRMVWMAWIVAREGLAICDEATTLSRVERDRPVIGHEFQASRSDEGVGEPVYGL